MRVLFRQLLLLVLCVTLTPGWMELVENVEHLVHDGHLAHQGAHDDDQHVAAHDALEAEHGCTPVSHICGCHASIPALLPADGTPLAPRRSAALAKRPAGIDDRPVHHANAPPVPPPRA